MHNIDRSILICLVVLFYAACGWLFWNESLTPPDAPVDRPLGCRERYLHPRPDLSVVFTFQAGTYGDGALDRPARRATARFLRQLWWLAECAERTGLRIEVVVLEWPAHPEKHSPCFRCDILTALSQEGLSLPLGFPQLRLLKGPLSLLNMTLPTLPVLEYYGKNIAARRALGDFILLGGSDSLPHEGIFDLLAGRRAFHGRQAPLKCYGAVRYLTESDIPREVGDDFEAYRAWRSDAYPLAPSLREGGERAGEIQHFHPKFSGEWLWDAAGDFTLCTREAVFMIRGYLETANRGHVDTMLLKHGAECGVCFDRMHARYGAFHQAHMRDEQQIIAQHAVDRDASMAQLTCVHNSPQWGLADVPIEEYYYSRGQGEWLAQDCQISPPSEERLAALVTPCDSWRNNI